MEPTEAIALSLEGPIQKRIAGSSAPLTAMQLAIWNYANAAGGTPLSLRMCASAVRVCGPLHVDTLERSIEAVVRRHEALRTRILVTDGVPRQQIDATGKYELRSVSLCDLSSIEAELEVVQQVQLFLDQRIDLSKDPIFEARLWRLSSREHVLVLLIDHIVTDGISNGTLSREIWTLYRQCERGLPFELPPLALQFADYAVWQERTYALWVEKHEGYWKSRFTGAPRIEIPRDSLLAGSIPPLAVTANLPLGRVLGEKLRAFAQGEGVLLSLVALTAYAVVISRWCEQEDLTIGFVSHGRYRSELQGTIGFIANILLLRVRVSGEDNFRDLGARIRSELASALRHQDYGRVALLGLGCSSEALFNWQATTSRRGRLDHHVMLESAGDLDWRPPWSSESSEKPPAESQLRIEPFRARSPSEMIFSPVLYDSGADIQIAVTYRQDLFTSLAIEQFADNFRAVCTTFVEDPRAAIGSIHVQHVGSS